MSSPTVNAPRSLPKRRARVRRIAAILGVFTALALGGLIAVGVALPRWIVAKVKEEGAAQGLAVDIGGLDLSFDGAHATAIKISNLRGDDRLRLESRAVDVSVRGREVSSVRAHGVALSLRGDPVGIARALEPPKSVETGPAAPPRPFTFDAEGRLEWREFAGDGSVLAFDAFALRNDPVENKLSAELHKGRLELGGFKLAPLDVTVAEARHADAPDDLDATFAFAPHGEGKLTATARHHATGDHVTLKLVELEIGRFLPTVPKVDLAHVSVDGDARFEAIDRAMGGEVALRLRGLAIPNIKVAGLLTIRVGGEVALAFKAVAKKGAPGVMTITDGRLEGTALGMKKAIAFHGEITVGDFAHPMLKVSLEWKSDSISCADLARVSGGGGASGALAGTAHATGRVEFDTAVDTKPRVSASLVQDCGVDALGAVDAAAKLLEQAMHP